MLKAIILLLFSASIITNACGQYASYRKYKYSWDHDFPTQSTIPPKFQDEDVVIFKENHDYKVSGIKGKYLKIYVNKYAHFKYLNHDGITDYSVFTLPQSFDPTFDKRDIPLNEKSPAHRPRIFDIKVAYFACRIRKKDGSVINAEIEDEMLTERKMIDLRFYSAYSYQFHIKNAEEGDEIEMEYQYEIPYNQNWHLYNSVSMFFHGKYPKQDYLLSFEFKKRLGTTFQYNNGCKPFSVTEEEEKVTYVFKESNLPGCIDELNARPHKELPYFVFNMAPQDMRFYYKMPGSLESAPLPFWIYILKKREHQSLWEQRRSDPLIIDKQYRKIRHFITTNTANVSNDNMLMKFTTLHNIIVQDFAFQKDGAYYAGLDNRLERLGDFTEDKVLREISRFKLYAKIFNFLKIPYHTIYFMDKRIAQMGNTYVSPVIDNEYAFVIPVNDGLYYIYPKQNQYGYYSEELPFYWEGSPALFVRFGNLWADKIAELNFITTPASTEKDNIRNSNVKVDVDLLSGNVSFEAKTSLSGQFSTMTRSVYEYGLMDSTLNPTYGKKIDEIGNGVISSGASRTSRSTKFPFKVNYNTKYNSANLITNSTDSVFQIDMKNWFHHIIEDQLENQGRRLSYYPDFRFQDIFKYYLIFNEDVNLHDDNQGEIKIANSLGSYRMTMNQLNPRTIMLESNYTVSADKVDALRIEDVITINKAIVNLNGSMLKVKKIK